MVSDAKSALPIPRLLHSKNILHEIPCLQIARHPPFSPHSYHGRAELRVRSLESATAVPSEAPLVLGSSSSRRAWNMESSAENDAADHANVLREVPVRNEDACDAMPAGQRWRLLLRRSLCACVCMSGEEGSNDDAQDGPRANGGINSSVHHKNDVHNDEESHMSHSRTVRQYNLTNKGNANGNSRRRLKTQNPFTWCLRTMSIILQHITRCLYQILCCGSARRPNVSLTHTNTNTAARTNGRGRSSWRGRMGDASNAADSNRFLSRFLNFTFRSSFLVVILLAAAGYYSLVCLFAAILVGAAKHDPTCVTIGGDPGFPGANETAYADAFSLSWTTLSTVGYGSYSPTTAQDSDNPAHCAFVTVICCVESFIGVLFGGFVGAIIYSKIDRVTSLAQVEFSHPMVIRYGSGVDNTWEIEAEAKEDEANSHEEGSAEKISPPPTSLQNNKKLTKAEEKACKILQAAFRGASVRRGDAIKKIPCPVLEFRIANRLHGVDGGEIMDAVIQVVASQDAAEADPILRNKMDEAKARWETAVAEQGLRNRAGLRVSTVVTKNQDTGVSSDSIDKGAAKRRGSLNRNVHFAATSVAYGVRSSVIQSKQLSREAAKTVMSTLTKKDHQAVDEDPTSRLIPKRIFSKLLIEASEHPYLRRIWLARHVVDETSPLLTPRARRLLKRNGGWWPESLNTYEGVKESIHFNQILVSLVGVSNLSGSEVYAQKVYENADCVVGYRFCNVLYRSQDGSLRVDLDLLNDVKEQSGGGGEPLIDT